MKRLSALLLVLVSSLLLFNCSDSTVAGGTTTSENTIVAGVILDADGNGVKDAEVILVPVDFDPTRDEIPDTLRTMTNKDGVYSISIGEAGIYNILAMQLDVNKTGITQGVVVPVPQGITIDADTTHIDVPGSIAVTVEELTLESDGYVYVSGTFAYLELDNIDVSSEFIEIEDVPASTYESISYHDPAAGSSTSMNSSPVTVVSEEVAQVSPWALWSHRFIISINTSSSGADISEQLIDFPLLVQLDSEDGVMMHSASDGDDIRITSADGSQRLEFELEQWNGAEESATLWVKVDTVLANNADQVLYLYIGNPDAGSVASGIKVFDTATGYQGVWHLNESFGTTSLDIINDATGNAIQGSAEGFDNANLSQAGIGGNAIKFDGIDDIIRIPNFNTPNTFTVSAWARSDSSEPYWAHVVGRWPDWFLGADSVRGNMRFSLNNIEAEVPFGLQEDIGITSWHLYTGVYDGENVRTYLDGQLINTIPYTGDIVSTGNTCIGGYCDSQGLETNWYGDIDEVRVSNVNRSEDWVKMSYESQRPGATVVSIGQGIVKSEK